MKKRPIIVSLGVGITVCVAALTVVATVGIPKSNDQLRAERGQESYYVGELHSYDLPRAVVNLAGEDGRRYLTTNVTIHYRLGKELDDARPLIRAKERAVGDLWVMLLGSKTYAATEGFENKNLLKEEIRAALERILFPLKRARIEDVLFNDFQVQ